MANILSINTNRLNTLKKGMSAVEVEGPVSINEYLAQSEGDICIDNVQTIGEYVFYNSTYSAISAPQVTTIGNYASPGCNSLISVDFPQATTIGNSAFSNCAALTSVDFPVATTIGERAFYSCAALTSVDFPRVTTIGNYAFHSCNSLTSVDFPVATTIGERAFYSCDALTSVDFPHVTTIENYAFYYCTALTSVDFPLVTIIGLQAFSSCPALTALILRNTDTVCSLSNKNALGSTPINSGTGYIYVPRVLIEDYKVATNWSTFANQFRAIEDYTVDGTTTGALDETKI